MLTRYFDTAAQIVERYGGTVEKFIGDAVMAVWGAPVAQRGRRRAGGARRARPRRRRRRARPGGRRADLRARAGVLTGEAAVTLGAEGQGMVAGDLVNTASRVQRRAEPGSVLVGETTKRADRGGDRLRGRGSHEMKGKAEPVQLWRASRVVGSRAARAARRARGAVRRAATASCGSSRSCSTRPRTTAGEPRRGRRRARHRQVAPGLGVREVRRRSGRERLVASRPLPLLRRRRRVLGARRDGARCAPASPRTIDRRTRSRSCDDDDRGARARRGGARWMEPRLRTCSGSTDRVAPDREDLLSAWRLFFERMAESGPVVLLFEDLHWADAGAARLHREPARLVAQPPALRAHALAAGARRAASDVRHADPQLHGADARAARRRRRWMRCCTGSPRPARRAAR